MSSQSWDHQQVTCTQWTCMTWMYVLVMLCYDEQGSTREKITSRLFSDNLVQSYISCRDSWSGTACQMLGNLCVLSLYDPDAAACVLYSKLQFSRAAVTSYAMWPVGMPWLYYEEDEARATLNSDAIKMSMAFKSESADTDDTLMIIAAVYDVYGEYKGLEPVANRLQLCNNANANTWLSYGHNYAVCL